MAHRILSSPEARCLLLMLYRMLQRIPCLSQIPDRANVVQHLNILQRRRC